MPKTGLYTNSFIRDEETGELTETTVFLHHGLWQETPSEAATKPAFKDEDLRVFINGSEENSNVIPPKEHIQFITSYDQQR